jgi:hypothetical protein
MLRRVVVFLGLLSANTGCAKHGWFANLSIHLTSGPFGDSMSAAARPKRWGVFRQAKGREFDPSRDRTFHPTYLTGRAIKGTWSNLGRQKEKEMKIHK